MTLLLLEDDQRIARGITRVVTSLGHRSRHVESIAAAKAELQKGDVTIIIADLGLAGGESGIDLLRWASEHHPQVRRVLTTGAVRPADYVESPPDQLFIHKPFGRAELVVLLGNTDREVL